MIDIQATPTKDLKKLSKTYKSVSLGLKDIVLLLRIETELERRNYLKFNPYLTREAV